MDISCFRVSDRPLIPVTVIDPNTGVTVDVEALIDTGFSGFLLVPQPIYDKISSLEIDTSRFYLTLNGLIKTKVAKVDVKIGSLILKGFAETPIFGRGLTLIGREMLKKLNVEFKKGEEICVRDP
ncbi:clan AA aspartic protease [Stygiolobus caldivivus]|nr:clan AA aspartic protease [Stygiolobus caldivivus]